MTEIVSWCHYCKADTPTEKLTNEIHTEEMSMHCIQIFKCGRCHKSTAFITIGKIQLLRQEAGV